MNMRAKRIFDLFCAMTGVILLMSVLLAISLWIKCDSRGPVIYRQVRVGRHGRMFRIYKFRTMYNDVGTNGREITVGCDPRITRAGNFLRRYKLDELPQLFNVIAGDMSLVGPRPEVPSYVAHYPEKIRNVILSVPPGMTDYASIEFRNESALLAQNDCPDTAYREEILPKKLNLGLKYVAEMSFFTDIRLIYTTITSLIHPTDTKC
jgi:lipopolysaccharide/colanic/teichoic acid biosynthesis glycosyltransferase